jgi:23S rRNA pseudouridine1911/1915/1917 synthase
MQGQKEVVSWISRYVTRQMLHALLLGFQHPTHGHYMEFEAPYPEDFQTVLKFLQSQ